MLDTAAIRTRFPIFQHRPELIYLDNAATTQKPRMVIAAITNFYQHENANIHRGVYDLAAQATQKYESVRQKVADFIGAKSQQEIVYTTGTTAAINLVAFSYLAPRLQAGDRVLVSAMEHHANLIPWQEVCRQRQAVLDIIPINNDGALDLEAYHKMLTPRTRMVAIAHISNTLGTINPIGTMIAMAHQLDIPILIDGAQSVAHYPVNMQELDCDFFTFSAHKLFGPTGTGILFGKKEHLASMPPCQFGGDMIRQVTYQDATYAPPPQRFEAGTTHIAGVIGLGSAIDFVNQLNRKAVQEHITVLGEYARTKLSVIPELKIIGTAADRTGIVSFTIDGVHPHDIATFLASDQVAVRAGHHCTQPLMDLYQIPATCRASFSIYNQKKEVDALVESVKKVVDFFA